jgi:von Willebrand factor type A domain/Aerotolerance regulator N-terminal
MSWINMLSGWQWLLMAMVPPLIVMLYFLKLRRMPVTVPSTYLWQKTIEDLHVNSIWQRLRKNLLLLLQLLVVAALILACLRPGFRGDEKLGKRSIFMIDNSCSMQSSDVKPSRLDTAKKEALKAVDTMAGSDVAMVIAFSDRADVRQGFTSDKRQLRTAIESIKPTNRTTDLSEALRAASGLANPGRTSQVDGMSNDVPVAEALPANIYLYSDGGFSTPQFDLDNLSAEFISIGSDEAKNVAVLAFTVERNVEKAGKIEAFARIHNFSQEPVTVTASLSMNDELVDASELTLEPESGDGVSFQLENISEGQLKLTLEADDDLKVDNVAFAGLDPPKQLEVVLVTEGNVALETALTTGQAKAIASVRIVGPDALNSDEIKQLAQSGTIDLFIYDQCSPEKMPDANTLFFGSLPPDDQWSAGELTGPLFVIDVNRAHPMLQYVDLGTVRMVEGRPLTLPKGGTALVQTDSGILVGVAPREAYQDAVLGLALSKRVDGNSAPNTDWPIKRSFPVFLLNALEYLGGAVSTAGSKTVKPGQPAILNVANRFNKIEIGQPGGNKSPIDRTGETQVIFTQTDELGFYETRPQGAENLLQIFTVNLFSEQESNIKVAEQVQIGTQAVVATSNQTEIVRVEYWRWLLALALVLLSVEWYLYNRRVAV